MSISGRDMRRTRALALTPAGRTLYEVVRRALGELDRTVDVLRGAEHRHGVAVTSFASLVSMSLLPRLAAFQGAHPDIDVRLIAVDRPLDLAAEGVDLAIRYCAPDRVPRATPVLFEDDVVPVCSPRLLERVGVPLRTPADLAHYPLIDYVGEWSGQDFLTWHGWLKVHGNPRLKPARTLGFTYFDQIVQAAIAGQGVAIARSPLVVDALEAGSLVLPFPGMRLRGYAYYLLRTAESAKRPEVRVFAEWLSSAAAATRKRRESLMRIPPRARSRRKL